MRTRAGIYDGGVNWKRGVTRQPGEGRGWVLAIQVRVDYSLISGFGARGKLGRHLIHGTLSSAIRRQLAFAHLVRLGCTLNLVPNLLTWKLWAVVARRQ